MLKKRTIQGSSQRIEYSFPGEEDKIKSNFLNICHGEGQRKVEVRFCNIFEVIFVFFRMTLLSITA